MKKVILAIIILISILFGFYFYQKQNYVTSEAVFVATDNLLNLSFKLDGKVVKLFKKEGERVKQGEILGLLDKNSLQEELNKINSKIASINHLLFSLSVEKDKLQKSLQIDKKILNLEINKTQNSLKVLNYRISANEAKLEKLLFDKKRFFKLYKSNKISFEAYKRVESEYKFLKNLILSQKSDRKTLLINIKILKEKLNLNKNNFKNLTILDEKIEMNYNQLLLLESTKKQIELKLKDTTLISPIDGIIAKKFVTSDMVVKRGTFIYSIVNLNDIYIKVLLSEKKLSKVSIGSQAIIKLDALNREIKGVVTNIMPVSASTFSLVPRDIASGEFTKLDQRFIVKIKIEPNAKIRIGMGGEVKIWKK